MLSCDFARPKSVFRCRLMSREVGAKVTAHGRYNANQCSTTPTSGQCLKFTWLCLSGVKQLAMSLRTSRSHAGHGLVVVIITLRR